MNGALKNAWWDFVDVCYIVLERASKFTAKIQSIFDIRKFFRTFFHFPAKKSAFSARRSPEKHQIMLAGAQLAPEGFSAIFGGGWR